MVSVMEEFYKKLTKGVRKSKDKIAIFICGSSGTGKTTSKDTLIKDAGLTRTFVYLNLDDNKDIIKTYAELQKVAYRVIEDGYNIVWDKTCRNTRDIFDELMVLKKKNYKTVISMVYAELGTVLKRVSLRTHQPVPPVILKSIYDELKRKAHRYMESPHVDEIFLYNNQNTLKLIYHKEDNEVECISPESKFYFDLKPYCS